MTADDWCQKGLAFADLSLAASTAAECDRELERAVEAFDRALELEPTHAAALRGRGLALATLGRAEVLQPEQALRAFEAALEERPRDIAALMGRAQALGALGRDAAALAAWDEALLAMVTRTTTWRGFSPGPIIDEQWDHRAPEARRARAEVAARLEGK